MSGEEPEIDRLYRVLKLSEQECERLRQKVEAKELNNGHEPDDNEVCKKCGLRKPEEFIHRTCLDHLRMKEDLLRRERDALRVVVAELERENKELYQALEALRG